MWTDDCEWCERQRQQCAFLQLQRCDDDQRRRVLRSELLRRVDERDVCGRVLLQLQRYRQQQQRMWTDDCEWCERQRQQCAFLQLQRCDDK